MKLWTAVFNKHKDRDLTFVDESKAEEKALNVDTLLVSKSDKMGLGSNPVLNELELNNVNIEEFTPQKNFPMESPSKLSITNKLSSIKLRNKTSSRFERSIKGRSTSELCEKLVRKEEKSLDLKQRPKSQFYDIEEIETGTEDENSLKLQSNIESSSQPHLEFLNSVTDVKESGSSKSNNLFTSTPQLSPPDGILRKFRKSFAVRFKKKTENNHNMNQSSCTSPVISNEPVSNFKSYLNYLEEVKHPENIDYLANRNEDSTNEDNNQFINQNSNNSVNHNDDNFSNENFDLANSQLYVHSSDKSHGHSTDCDSSYRVNQNPISQSCENLLSSVAVTKSDNNNRISSETQNSSLSGIEITKALVISNKKRLKRRQKWRQSILHDSFDNILDHSKYNSKEYKVVSFTKQDNS